MAKEKLHIFALRRFGPGTESKENFYLQVNESGTFETKSLLNIEGKNIRKDYCTCPEISHPIISSTDITPSEEKQHSCQLPLGSPLGLDTLACRKSHKTMKGLIAKEKMKKANYILLP